MARRSRMSILKRQRELKKAEKAAHKRARRHGIRDEFTEPTPTFGAAEMLRGEAPVDADEADGAEAPEDAPSEQKAE